MKHQMFDNVQELKYLFWNNYQKRKEPRKYKFDVPIRNVMVDLIALEHQGEEEELVAYVFETKDIQNALTKANHVMKYVNHCWIVLPIEKEKAITNRYVSVLKESRYIGVIGVKKPNGFYKRFYIPDKQNNLEKSAPILDLLNSNTNK